MKRILLAVAVSLFAASAQAAAHPHRPVKAHPVHRGTAIHHSGAASTRAAGPAKSEAPKAPVNGDGMQSDFERGTND